MPKILNQALETMERWTEGLPSLSPKTAYVLGGSIVRAMREEPASDLDICFPSANKHDAYYDKLRPLAKRVETTDFTNTFFLKDNRVVQLVHYAYGTPEELFEGFDLSLCKAGYDGVKLFAKPGVFDELEEPHPLMEVEGDIKYPASTWDRIGKYTRRGFIFSDDDILRVYKAMATNKTERKPSG